jgi:hypothetical protein
MFKKFKDKSRFGKLVFIFHSFLSVLALYSFVNFVAAINCQLKEGISKYLCDSSLVGSEYFLPIGAYFIFFFVFKGVFALLKFKIEGLPAKLRYLLIYPFLIIISVSFILMGASFVKDVATVSTGNPNLNLTAQDFM